jgi:hypothetical protein
VRNAGEKFSQKNTIDLQWKMRANYNARPCDGERKAAGAGTMKNNGKNNAQNNGNSRNPGAYSRSAWSHRRPTKTIARRREAPGAHVQD